MSSAVALRHPFPVFLTSSARHLFKPPSPLSSSSPFSSSSSKTLTLALDLPGPSLRRGRPAPSPPAQPSPSPSPSPDSYPRDELINKAGFARTFDVAALRVPAEQCAALERRLRGHLLNWPRLPNVARVPGDDPDSELKTLLRDPSFNGEQRLEALARRGTELSSGAGGGGGRGGGTLSPVLYREKLVKEFNFRGFINFRNLAKISRPKKKKDSKEGLKKDSKERLKEAFRGREREGKNGIYAVEVVGEVDEEEDMRGLLGEEFQRGRWMGSTRLLLLDEQYANKGIEELPEAVKVASRLCELLFFLLFKNGPVM